MLNFKIVKRHLTRYVSRLLKKGLRRHRRWYDATLTDGRRQPHQGTSLGGLPVDVFSDIVAILHDERAKESIVACSLVSKRWREVALPYLFSTIAAREEEDFDAFLAFFAGAPHLSRCIRTLTLTGEGEGDAQLDCSAFSALFPSLTGLRQLFLQDLTLHVPSICAYNQSIGHRHSARYAMLDALEVDNVRCEDSEKRLLPVIPTVLDMLPITCVHLLRFDRLGDVANEENTDFQAGVPIWMIDVCHLSVVAPDGAATAAYFAFYEKLVQIGSLACLSTFCETWSDAEALSVFLHAQSSSVVTVDLDVTRLMEQERCSVELPRRRWKRLAEAVFACTNLSSLRLHIPWNKRDLNSSVHPRYTVFADISSIAVPRTLRDFQVWLKLPQFWSFADAHATSSELWDLSVLDRVLCNRDNFPELQRVLVIMQADSSVPPGCLHALEGRIAEREWPRLDGRGLLYFQWYTPIFYGEDSF